MIRYLRLQNFKCFEDQIIEFAPLTLLSGLNGMGKSSVIQALLVLRQSAQQRLLDMGEIALNGDLACIGTAKDALFEGAKEDKICFEIGDDIGNKERWCFLYEETGANVLVWDEAGSERSEQPLDTELLYRNDFHYLNTERISPRTTFEISDVTVRQHKQLGTHGEYTAHFLSIFGRDDIPNAALAHPKAESLMLRHQVEAWLGEFSPGTRLNLMSHPEMDVVNQFVTGNQTSNHYRATNVGFGLTYILPVLVAVLASPQNSLILCENPEAHLHPKGQVIMGELMSLAANCGIQLIAETHSDHVLNGIRIAVHSGKIEPDKVRLHFFQRSDDQDQPRTQVITPRMDQDGRIDVYPEGFFDEWDKSLEALLEPKGI
jgi:predicted ATPase